MPFFTKNDEVEEIEEELEDEIEEAEQEVWEEDGAMAGDFQLGGTAYEIKFIQKRIDLYEGQNKPIMATFMQNGGAFSRKELESLLSFGLKRLGGTYLLGRKSVKVAAAIIQQYGYVEVLTHIMEALERDCGFLFATNEE
jgi:hypothetical protein